MKNAQTDNEKPLPNSRRIYIHGQQPDVRVPFREIDQNSTRNFKGELEENPPVRVYDTSGPYGDPSFIATVREGMPGCAGNGSWAAVMWKEYEGRALQPIDDGYLTFDAASHAAPKKTKDVWKIPCANRTPLRAKAGACVSKCTTPDGHHHARDGIHRYS